MSANFWRPWSVNCIVTMGSLPPAPVSRVLRASVTSLPVRPGLFWNTNHVRTVAELARVCSSGASWYARNRPRGTRSTCTSARSIPRGNESSSA